MPTIIYNNREIECNQKEYVIEALIRSGLPVKYSCKKGVCKTCKLELVTGDVPRAATRAYEHLDENYFLPCLSKIENTIVIKSPEVNGSLDAKHFEHHEESNDDKPAPSPELMERLERDDLLNTILHSFYDEVYEDPQLSPYFDKVEKSYVIQKQYSFLYMLFSGKEIYMGERTRNAHHWMVISDELFDYREAMMARHMYLHGLEENFVAIWQGMQEYFRSRMVKDSPWKRIWDGYQFPLEGMVEELAVVGMVCDHCQEPIAVGDKFKYHVHSAKVYCRKCGTTVK